MGKEDVQIFQRNFLDYEQESRISRDGPGAQGGREDWKTS